MSGACVPSRHVSPHRRRSTCRSPLPLRTSYPKEGLPRSRHPRLTGTQSSTSRRWTWQPAITRRQRRYRHTTTSSRRRSPRGSRRSRLGSLSTPRRSSPSCRGPGPGRRNAAAGRRAKARVGRGHGVRHDTRVRGSAARAKDRCRPSLPTVPAAQMPPAPPPEQQTVAVEPPLPEKKPATSTPSVVMADPTPAIPEHKPVPVPPHGYPFKRRPLPRRRRRCPSARRALRRRRYLRATSAPMGIVSVASAPPPGRWRCTSGMGGRGSTRPVKH